MDTRELAGYEGLYTITTTGIIRNKYGRIKSQGTDKHGYKTVVLSSRHTLKHHFVHRLICLTFLPNPDNKPQVNHKNGIRNDNRLENLEWCTAKENVHDGFKRGRKVGITRGEDSVHHKLKETQIPAIREMLANGEKVRNISKLYNVSYSTIYEIKTGKKWTHVK